MSKTQETSNTENSVVDALFSVGAHFGFVKSRRHPSAKPFIFGVKNKIEIFDLEKTSEALHSALEFVETLGSKNAMILFVSGKEEAKKAIVSTAESITAPYVAGRFIGGTLTNFPEIRKRVEKMERLVSERDKGELAKYTKKERLLIDRDIAKLKEFFFGISVMKNLPQALFVIDAKAESIAVKEAKKIGIPVVALCGTDNDLSQIDYPIPGNDSSKASIEFFLQKVANSYKIGQLKKEEVK
ncbi:MAG: 30S ribosomal protein S2 [Candidatus Zambryskibacteria bacterium RIFCSPLOWO2_12_FULL_39_45]|uniref:Small ribosomal subunit protein uS2 n=3 Tax=Candidatus Zambryskiibacteriota TaxID=1817925 RepID=A0A1G2T646_9BACT|nr:MAG: 30S ribosomal protein S2 [Candidatus Zambryskibacteria bacterium RIFCSPHIGHO2_02_38_10.5]OHA97098.1 MAG: 30S ribosomal protein S2 [Candidatus Zambryskibacteria bacterium RIFCSPHIGHO2_02_FULL_39_82]OHA99752.1 MAG: 30S ribosomal protein S2 [Candidatus Zambryskibacteria bacterium RIFCSPHIGHO2_12_FULL_38_37]OHB11598.1 MAG: 30S ribosomal protein S2 [Candidatus Zambryskibacteria bacterium RIFCSPLOWO2_02_FULL_39_69]OHB13113.1 MAG: 30S ribosomal protein S2 [Candidatus Zambryskibacteria bacteriu